MRGMILAIVLFSSTACVPSINPYYTDSDVYFDVRLLGEWAEENGNESWVFEAGAENDYRLTYTDEDKKTGTFAAKLFKLGNRSLLDIRPLRSASGQNDLYVGHLLPLHTYVEITVNGNSGHVAYLDSTWLNRLLEKNPNAIRHAVWSERDIFLIDSTRNLQAFLVANFNSPEAYVRSTDLTRKPFRK